MGRRRDEAPSTEDVAAWFAGRLPDEWFTGTPEVTVDREEITVLGTLPGLEDTFSDEAARSSAESGRVSRFREQTREERISIARQAEHRFHRKVAWGARLGGTEEVFTSLAVPVMTRLRQPERIVLDTLVSAGVARSRSDALSWAVRLVGEHTESWLAELREAMQRVDELRNRGPEAD
ncbi:hypothetical protein [Sciscionella marina]|uniref:hypothetical protein n=1 Tax=Sciscionella marina TaxID=508770 RepID=UPI00035E1734|nr:hypothetical protein [Sciscionella marina]